MKNFEKYKTVNERTVAFGVFLVKHNEYANIPYIEAAMRWLDLEAEEEKPLKCPFCGSECDVQYSATRNYYYVRCKNQACAYGSTQNENRDLAIYKHNRVARAVMKELRNEE